MSGVRTVIREAGRSQPFFKDVFLPLAKAYTLIRSGGEGVLPGQMPRILSYLNRLSDADWAPAAILALKDCKATLWAAFLLAEIDRLAYLTRLLCAGSGKRVRRFADLVKAIRSGEPIDETHPALQLTRDEVRSIAFISRIFISATQGRAGFFCCVSATNSAVRRPQSTPISIRSSMFCRSGRRRRVFGGSGSRTRRSVPTRR